MASAAPVSTSNLLPSTTISDVERLSLSVDSKPDPAPFAQNASLHATHIESYDARPEYAKATLSWEDAFMPGIRSRPPGTGNFKDTNMADGSGKTTTGTTTTSLMDLPEEIQQLVLSILIGNLRSTSSVAHDSHGTKDWSRALRHPRAKEVTNLALISRGWRTMVQERLYRHRA